MRQSRVPGLQRASGWGQVLGLSGRVACCERRDGDGQKQDAKNLMALTIQRMDRHSERLRPERTCH